MLWNMVVWLALFFSGTVGVPVTISQSPQQVTVTEGGTVQLNCTYSRRTAHTGDSVIGALSWYKDVENRSVCNTCSGYSGRVLQNEVLGIQSSSIEIIHLRMNDTGRYYCQVDIFMDGKYLGSGTEVRVTRTVGVPVTISQSPQQVTVTEGGTVQLNCTYSRITTHTGDSVIGALSWYKDVENRSVCNTCSGYSGRVVQNKVLDIQSSSIEIIHLRMNDTGRYYCQMDIFMNGKYLGSGTEVIVTQTVGVRETIMQSPQRITVTEGETVHLTCTFSRNTNYSGGRAIAAVSWYKDDEDRSVLNTCNRYNGRVLENSSQGIPGAAIEITDLKVTDTGRYYCQVDTTMEGKYFGNGTVVTVIRRNTTESSGRDLRWQVVEMGLKLAIFVVINIVTVFLIRLRESHGIVNRNNVI